MSQASVEMHEIKLPPNFKDMPVAAKQSFLAALAGALMEHGSDSLTHAQVIEMLEAAHSSYHTQHEFKAGDLVMLKPELSGFYNHPKPGDPCKVLEMLLRPHFTDNDNSPALGVPQDMRIGLIGGRTISDYGILTVCSHFFMPYKAPEAAQAEQPKEAGPLESVEAGGPF